MPPATMDTMERKQEARGLDRIFSPRSLAVVGASSNPAGVGHKILRNIRSGGFAGRTYVVHPRDTHVLGVPAFRSPLDLPEAVDMAVVAVPAKAVLQVAEECGRRGVGGLVVVSAGFREIGPEGVEREQALRGIVTRYGMRLVGPNCLGIQNLHPDVRLDATFVHMPSRPGPVALMTQSGAVGIAMVEHAARIGLGIGRFASMGNKLDVSGNDLLLLWESAPDVRLIVLYLESFGNPINFVRIARRVGRTKPILVLKSGRTSLGARAAGSHTGALAEGDDMVDALFEQCGVLRAAAMEELFDLAAALAFQPPPSGGRTAIVTNSGGPGIMAVDAMSGTPLTVAELSSTTVEAVRAILPAEAAVQNPIDLLAAGGPDQFRGVLDGVLADPGVDAVVAMYTPVGDVEVEVARAITQAHRARPSKPVLSVWMGKGPAAAGYAELVANGIPTYMFPESAIRSLAAGARLAAWRARPEGTVPEFPTPAEARAPVHGGPDGWVGTFEALQLCQAYGLPVPSFQRVRSEVEAEGNSKGLRFPLVLKAQAKGLVHKSDVGGVRLGLTTPAAVAQEYRAMADRVRAAGFAMESALAMEEAPAGRELLLGGIRDPRFGPIVVLGLGGVYAEVFQDVVLRMAPLTDEDAKRMVRSLKSYPLLAGVRGEHAIDVPAVVQALLRLSQLLVEHPEIVECDLNPVRVFEQGASLLDARFRVTTPTGPSAAKALNAAPTGRIPPP